MSLAHHCHAERCTTSCPPRFLMCPRHWRMVPRALQNEVYRTVDLRDGNAVDATWAPWWRAQERAISAVALLEGVITQEQHDQRIARADDFAAELEAKLP